MSVLASNYYFRYSGINLLMWRSYGYLSVLAKTVGKALDNDSMRCCQIQLPPCPCACHISFWALRTRTLLIKKNQVSISAVSLSLSHSVSLPVSIHPSLSIFLSLSQMAYTQHSWMLMDIVVGLSVRPSVRLFVYGIFRWLCICWQITWNKWHKIWHADVSPSLISLSQHWC